MRHAINLLLRVPLLLIPQSLVDGALVSLGLLGRVAGGGAAVRLRLAGWVCWFYA
jgi:hypothetical protein